MTPFSGKVVLHPFTWCDIQQQNSLTANQKLLLILFLELTLRLKWIIPLNGTEKLCQKTVSKLKYILFEVIFA